MSICRTKVVPNSGIAMLPTSQSSSSSVTPRGSLVRNIFMVSGSSRGIVWGSKPVISFSILSTVGSSWPSISSFTSLSSMA